MALFGDLGKALGIEDAGDILPLAASAAGFYFGGPAGAALGGGIGSLATGGNIKDALGTAALAYGVSSFVSPSLMAQSAQARGGIFGTNALQQSLYGAPTQIAQTGTSALGPSDLVAGGDPGMGTENLVSDVATATAEPSLFDKALGFAQDKPFLTAGLGLGALGLMGALGEEEEEARGASRPQPEGEAFGVVYDDKGRAYEIKDPVQRAAYAAEMSKTQRPGFQYDTSGVFRNPEEILANSGVFAAKGKYKNFDDEDFFRMTLPPTEGGQIKGPGSGTSDSVVAGIYSPDGKYEGPARLSDGEFVITEKAMRGAGGGDRDIGAARMYDMMAELEAVA
jgi:hypothetical protein